MRSEQGFPPTTEKTDNTVFDVGVKKLTFGRGENPRSRKFGSLLRIMDVIYKRLSTGQSVSELEIQPMCGIYPADGLRAMRWVHRNYPHTTVLRLVNGIWQVEPCQ